VDKRLKEQSDTIGELLGSPWLEKGSAGLDGFTTRLREAFAQTARGLPQGYLEAQAERLLLEQRHYQKRTLLGQEWIRALLTPAGAAAGEAIPTYLPERLSKELPMFQRRGAVAARSIQGAPERAARRGARAGHAHAGEAVSPRGRLVHFVHSSSGTSFTRAQPRPATDGPAGL
jgi:hypothetical protein